jgi:hypothetical protein
VQILMDSILWQRKLGSKEVHEHARVRAICHSDAPFRDERF